MGAIGNLGDRRLCYDYKNRKHGVVEPDTKRAPFQWVSEISYKNKHRIVSRGYDTTELVEQGYGLADMIFIDFQARIPLIEEQKMLNYIMILALEDGLSTPAAVSRMIAKSKTYLTQAVGASILAFGHAYSAYSAFGNMIGEYLARAEKEGKTLKEIAEVLVKEYLNEEFLGVSNLMLRDPSAKRMFARAEKLGVAGKYISFTKEIVKEAQKISKEPVDLVMLGAIGATMMDLDFSPEATWAILAITRAFTAGAHFCEEMEREPFERLGQRLTPKEYYDGPEDRPVPSIEKRKTFAKAETYKTPEEWKKGVEKKKKLKGSGWAIEEEIQIPKKSNKNSR